jgi:hypothetical protein
MSVAMDADCEGIRIREVPARDRLTNVHFDPRLEFQASISVGTYACPSCDSKAQLTTADFQTHLFLDRSSLPERLERCMSRHRPRDAAKGECFLDFCCKGCGLAVRIVFEPWAFRMGDYGFDATSVVEATVENAR